MTSKSDTNLSAKRILLVEDDPAVCYFLERVLTRAGYFVGMAADGVSGLRFFRAQPWDLVITDRTMPEVNGEELASEIKKEAPAQPIILIAGIPSCVEHTELFDAVFGKPFSIPALLACVSVLIDITPHEPDREMMTIQTAKPKMAGRKE